MSVHVQNPQKQAATGEARAEKERLPSPAVGDDGDGLKRPKWIHKGSRELGEFLAGPETYGSGAARPRGGRLWTGERGDGAEWINDQNKESMSTREVRGSHRVVAEVGELPR